jgi:3-isopropylmalate/(R)-2-methylmalate dehydratase large subunit
VTQAPQTLTERILARAAKRGSVRPGDEIWATADRMIMNDSSGPRRLAGLVEELGGIWDPARVVVASDHFVPASNLRHAAILKTTREWAKREKVGSFYEYEGILHNLVLENGLAASGQLVVGADSHSTTAGAAGAVAVAVGSTELATVLATGNVWLRVPESVRIEIDGVLPRGTTVRDVTMRIFADLGASFALQRAVEFGGTWTAKASLEERLVLANQGCEMGAHNAVVENGQVPDRGATYALSHRIDARTVVPMVARHPSPANVAPARDVTETVDTAWIGSCAGGRREDLEAAAAVLRGKKAAIPLLVTPATRAIYSACLASGAIAALTDAGATVLPPGCGACAGVHGGVQGDGDRIIATATRNFPGRMGSREARVFLGSAYTVAATALTGRIVDPREVWKGDAQ